MFNLMGFQNSYISLQNGDFGKKIVDATAQIMILSIHFVTSQFTLKFKITKF